MLFRIVIWCAVLMLAGCGEVGSFGFSDAWARVPAPSGLDTVVYAKVENRTSQERKIVGAESVDARAVEMHEMKLRGDTMGMGEVQAIRLPANGRVEFSPTGYHLMVFGLKKRPVPGDKLHVTLTLDDGTRLMFPATVRANE